MIPALRRVKSRGTKKKNGAKKAHGAKPPVRKRHGYENATPHPEVKSVTQEAFLFPRGVRRLLGFKGRSSLLALAPAKDGLFFGARILRLLDRLTT